MQRLVIEASVDPVFGTKSSLAIMAKWNICRIFCISEKTFDVGPFPSRPCGRPCPYIHSTRSGANTRGFAAFPCTAISAETCHNIVSVEAKVLR
jgi:hypothetical protein